MPSKDTKELDFPHSDGNENLWPSNTTRLVDSEGHVNYMHPIVANDDWDVRWRKSVGGAVAVLMKLPTGLEYILKSWPNGYRMFIHNKGPQANPRTDKYLIGSTNVARFRSIPEFVPHALWLITDPTQTRSNCQCKYCSKKPQRNITESFGLGTRPSPSLTSGHSRHSVLRPPIKRERKPRDIVQLAAKPYAAVRRTPKPVKLPTGPKQSVIKERNSDLRASTVTLKRWYREGEVLWCALNPPIRSSDRNPDSNIVFWPGIIRGFRLGRETVPRSTYTNDSAGMDTDMDGATSRILPSSVAPTDANDVPWKVHQWIIYKVSLLAVPHTYDISDDQVLPYQAYGPSSSLLEALRSELALSGKPEGAFSFVPCPNLLTKAPEQNRNQEMNNDSGQRFKAAAAPFSSAIEIAASLAFYWTATDDWEFKFTIPQDIPPPSMQEQTLNSAISASLSNNEVDSISAPPGRVTGPVRNVSRDRLHALSDRLLGPQSSIRYPSQSFTQRRYQGLWWGAERLWTDDLVRLKLARKQIAPDGAEHILPPAGPSKSALEVTTIVDTPQAVDLRGLGAGERGVFMKLESLFAVELPQGDGSKTHELRASGMLHELVDADWVGDGFEQQGSGKGKERAHDEIGFAFNDIRQSSSFNEVNLDPILRNGSNTIVHSDAPRSAGRLSKTRSPNSQLSNPGMNCPLPDPPEGFKFRAILPPGHEAVVSLTLISGRYYPGLLSSPCMGSCLEKAFSSAFNAASLDMYHHIWALEGLSPGFHNSVDPSIWKKSRQDMMIAADQDAKSTIEDYFQQQRNQAETVQEQGKVQNGDRDVEMMNVET